MGATRAHKSRPTTERSAAARSVAGSDTTTVAGVRITHPDRVLYPDVGLTKLQIATFYESIADWILPHLADRPLTLVRCPDGIGSSCFFMKHSGVWAPKELRRVRIRERTKTGEYLVVDSLPALIGLVQMDVLEIHTWNSRVEHLERPDRIIFDLDPGPAVPWPDVIAAARVVRDALDALNLRSFVKTTGGRGLHVVLPLEPRASWDQCLSFARGLAEAVAGHSPTAYTTAFSKAGRERKILIDYLRNSRANTSIAAFSTRARAGAPVSVPLAWEELSGRRRSDHYSVGNLGRHLSRLPADPWAEYWTIRQQLPADVLKRVDGASRKRSRG